MCVLTYTSSAVIDEPKIHWVVTEGESPPTAGRGGQRHGTRGGVPMPSKASLVLISICIWGFRLLVPCRDVYF